MPPSARATSPRIINGLTPDVHWHSAAAPRTIPAFGPRKGHAEVQDFFKIVAENNDFAHFSPREFYAADDKVFVLGDYAMTLEEDGQEVRKRLGATSSPSAAAR